MTPTPAIRVKRTLFAKVPLCILLRANKQASPMEPVGSADVWASEGTILTGGRRRQAFIGMIEQRDMDQRRKGAPALDEARLRQQAIGVKLRQMFDQVVNEPVPDEFLDILRKADKPAGDR